MRSLLLVTLLVLLCASLAVAEQRQQLAVGLIKPLANGGILVETFQLNVFRPFSSDAEPSDTEQNNLLVGDRHQDGASVDTTWRKRSEWPDELQVSFCDSLVRVCAT
jgi:hypothetical protein